jgi:hypothetical protein
VSFDHRLLVGRVLADTPSAWEVQLPDDKKLVIYASSYGPEGEGLVYDVLLAGRPPELVTLVSGPAVLLGDVYTREPEELPANDFDWQQALNVEFLAVPDSWFLRLTDGHELLVHANDLEERDGEHLFTLKVRGGGAPLPVARVSRRLVADVRREPVEPSAADQAQRQDR